MKEESGAATGFIIEESSRIVPHIIIPILYNLMIILLIDSYSLSQVLPQVLNILTMSGTGYHLPKGSRLAKAFAAMTHKLGIQLQDQSMVTSINRLQAN